MSRGRVSRPRAFRLAVLASAMGVGCVPSGDAPARADLSPFAPGRRGLAEVRENRTACTVDAVCALQLRYRDTTIVAVYGAGERDALSCPIDVLVSDAAFDVAVGDLVEAVVGPCAELGLVLLGVAPAASR